MTSWLGWLFSALIKHAQASREAWRLAVEYRDQAAKLGEPPYIGEKPRHADEA